MNIPFTEINQVQPLGFLKDFSNQVYYSNVSGYKEFISYCSSFSIKYTVKGQEFYVVNGKQYSVSSNNYLLVNNGSEVEFHEAKGETEAISVFFDGSLINEVWNWVSGSDDQLLDYTEVGHQNNLEFLENTYQVADQVGSELKKFHQKISYFRNKGCVDSNEFIYNLIISLIRSQRKVRIGVESISRLKPATRKELYRRLLKAKMDMDGNPQRVFDLNRLTQIACLTKFHFIRTFKEAFGKTPYQYFMSLKMKEAKKSLKKADSLSELAVSLGFNDLHVFSKCFKRYYGEAPSIYSRNDS